MVPNEKVVFTFGWEEKDHPIPPGSTTLEITLHPEGDKTRVRLVHRGLPADAVEDHGHGWAHYLERLAIAATGGDAGPDTSIRRDARTCRRDARRGVADAVHRLGASAFSLAYARCSSSQQLELSDGRPR